MFVVLILVLGTLWRAPEKLDNYIDGMNYMAFAACVAGLVPLALPVKGPTPLPAVKLQDAAE